jgi:hypothetical protein
MNCAIIGVTAVLTVVTKSLGCLVGLTIQIAQNVRKAEFDLLLRRLPQGAKTL